MIPFYEELKQTRESLGLTIEQLSNRTKISKEIISSIETGDLNILPKTYLRLFIKAYAQEMNLDPQDILHHFEEYLEATKVPLTDPKVPNPIVVIPENNEIHENHQVDKKRNRNFATIVIILVITIFMISVLKQIMTDQKKKNSIAAFPDTAVTQAIHTADTSADSQVVTSQANLKLTVLTKDTCWIKIIVDNRDTFEATLPPHYRKDAVATEQFDVRVGRPAGVNLILNDKDLGPVGVPGIPTRLIINKNGIIRRQSFTTR